MAPAVNVENDHQFLFELRQTCDLTGIPLSSHTIDDDLGDLIDETYARGVLAQRLPAEAADFCVRIVPVFSETPIVERIEVHLTVRHEGTRNEFALSFQTGRWVRQSLVQLARLQDEGVLGRSDPVYRMVLAMAKDGNGSPLPSLEPPAIQKGRLEDFGVRQLEDGPLLAERPVLVNRRLVTDSVEACLAADVRETGKAVLGLHVQLPQPLPGTSTRIVTLLTACVDDRRHTGEVNQWKISPEALDDAARIADVRGLGERVLTVLHTHGWSNECGKCNENAGCPLAECTDVSLQDYQVLEMMFPSKATLMPIVGRKLGAAGKRPVLVIHAWQNGCMKPIDWRPYRD